MFRVSGKQENEPYSLWNSDGDYTDSIAPCWEQEVEYLCIEYKLYMIYSQEVYLKYYIPGNLKLF